MTAKRTKTVTVTFSVSPKSFKKEGIPFNCTGLEIENPISSLYLTNYLNNYFETINFNGINPPYKDASLTDSVLHAIRPIRDPPPVPSQLKIQSVELATTILLMADVSAGATPSVLGNGAVFIVPINGLGVDYNPDYSHKIDVLINLCDQSDPSCNPKSWPANEYRLAHGIAPPQIKGDADVALLVRQCTEYGLLNPLFTVKPPKDYIDAKLGHVRCGKNGQYSPVMD
jgi:hypothetical protein